MACKDCGCDPCECMKKWAEERSARGAPGRMPAKLRAREDVVPEPAPKKHRVRSSDNSGKFAPKDKSRPI